MEWRQAGGGDPTFDFSLSTLIGGAAKFVDAGRDAGYRGKDIEYTDEQQAAAQAFSEDKPLKVKAFAGTGKTTVLELMARRDGRQGLYIAYNNEIARASRRKFPKSVVCKTAHALALDCLTANLKEKAHRGNQLKQGQLERFLNRRVALSRGDARDVAPVAAKAMHWFCVSNDPYPALQHVQRALADSYMAIDPDKVLAVLPAMWEAIASAEGRLPLTFDGYLKVVQLSGKPLPFDYVLADECQDMYAAIQSIVRNSGAQIAWVGDPNQQIYDFNGAENAMLQLDGLESYSLTMAFRFGEWLAELVQPLLYQLGQSDVIRGNPSVDTRRAKHTMPVRLARGNATLLSPLVKAIKAGKKVHVLGGTQKLLRLLNSAESVMRQRPVRTGIFAGLRSWHEARERASERGNRDLREMVELIERYKLRGVRHCVESVCATEKGAQLILSTVHQAKGREFARVALLDDFRKKPEYLITYRGKALYAPAPETLRLLYVALTRAENELFVPMSLARRFGIADELKNIKIPARMSTPMVHEDPPEPLIVEPEPWLESGSYTYHHARAPNATSVVEVKAQRREPPDNVWDRWGLPLMVVLGVVANLAMLVHKGYIDLSLFGVVFGK